MSYKIKSYIKNFCDENNKIGKESNLPSFTESSFLEIIKKAKTGMSFPYMAWESPERGYRHKTGKLSRTFNLALSLIDKCNDKNADDVRESLVKIFEELLQKIQNDIDRGDPRFLSGLEWESVDMADLPYNAVDKTVGERIVFQVVTKINY